MGAIFLFTNVLLFAIMCVLFIIAITLSRIADILVEMYKLQRDEKNQESE